MDSYRSSLYSTPRSQGSSPPSTGRKSWHSYGSAWPLPNARLARFNGNYEGDLSMFRTSAASTPRMPDQESETSIDAVLQSGELRPRLSRIQVLMEQYKAHLSAAGHCQTAGITAATTGERHSGSFLSRSLYDLFYILATTFLWIVQLLLKHFIRWINGTYGIWRGRALLRRATRHLLWYLTKAKCGETLLFLQIAVIAPILFFCAVFGLTLALYSWCKTTFTCWFHKLRIILY